MHIHDTLSDGKGCKFSIISQFLQITLKVFCHTGTWNSAKHPIYLGSQLPNQDPYFCKQTSCEYKTGFK